MPIYTGDLTQGKTYSASSVLNNSSSYVAARAFDINYSTMWHSGNTGQNWIKVDFGDPVAISKVTYTSEEAYQVAPILQGSNDDSSWTDVFQLSGLAKNASKTFEFSNYATYRYYRLIGNTTGYFNARTLEMYAQIFTYKSTGSYTCSPIDLSTIPTTVRFRTEDNAPADTSIVYKYAVNQSNSTPPETWTDIVDEDVVELPDPATGYHLWIKVLLATTDTNKSPFVSAIWLEDITFNPKLLRVHLTNSGRLRFPQGVVTVAYNRTAGGMQGRTNSFVEDWEEDFTPTGITDPVFNPNVSEFISMTPTVTSQLLKVTYNYSQGEEHISLTPSVTATLIHIDDLEQ